jgi:hypothetical protein
LSLIELKKKLCLLVASSNKIVFVIRSEIEHIASSALFESLAVSDRWDPEWQKGSVPWAIWNMRWDEPGVHAKKTRKEMSEPNWLVFCRVTKGVFFFRGINPHNCKRRKKGHGYIDLLMTE